MIDPIILLMALVWLVAPVVSIAQRQWVPIAFRFGIPVLTIHSRVAVERLASPRGFPTTFDTEFREGRLLFGEPLYVPHHLFKRSGRDPLRLSGFATVNGRGSSLRFYTRPASTAIILTFWGLGFTMGAITEDGKGVMSQHGWYGIPPVVLFGAMSSLFVFLLLLSERSTAREYARVFGIRAF